MGGVTQEAIESVVGRVGVRTHSSSNPKSPGQLQSHYAPDKIVVTGDIEALRKKYSMHTFGILSFEKNFDSQYQIILSPSGSLSEAAQNLFTALRRLDKMPIKYILAEHVPDTGLGKAINDRLRRAAG
jgi:L-threonylcarbamoyladenylate synthase